MKVSKNRKERKLVRPSICSATKAGRITSIMSSSRENGYFGSGQSRLASMNNGQN
jgi:hypothetical protein